MKSVKCQPETVFQMCDRCKKNGDRLTALLKRGVTLEYKNGKKVVKL